MKITNFGGNVSYEPAHYYEPRTEDEVLDIITKHTGGTVRVIASGHAWSSAIKTYDTAIRLDKMNDIQVLKQEDGSVVVRAAGGASLRAIVNAVETQTSYTLPTMGGILKQTIAGAISTGTHGSGRHSLSHYMDEIRTVAYDTKSGQARIYTYSVGDELRAARCAVGCMGVIVSVTFRCVPKYAVAETVSELKSVNELFERDSFEYLEQAILLPYSWRLLAYDRVVIDKPLSTSQRIRASIHSIISILYIDISLHLIIVSVVFAVRRKLAGIKFLSWLYSAVIPRAIPKNITHTGSSTDMLTLKHDLFRHLEMELFIPKHNVGQATDVVKYIISVAAGNDIQLQSDEVLSAISSANTMDAIEDIRDTYIHHYPLYFRRILPDDTLISMAAGNKEPYYSLSFFTYYPPGSRDPFYAMCAVIAKTLAVSFDVRPHWGKYNPLSHEEIAHLYPNMQEFHCKCRAVDPEGTFSNEYTRRALGI